MCPVLASSQSSSLSSTSTYEGNSETLSATYPSRLARRDFRKRYVDNSASLDTNGGGGPTSSKSKRDASPMPQFFLGGHSISTVFTDDNDQNGYNITLPPDTCANAVVGDFQSPSGQLVQDATVRDIMIELRSNYKYEGFLRQYTLDRARELQGNISTLLPKAVCNPLDSDEISSRELLSALDLGSGLWTALLLYTPLGGGVAWAVLDVTLTAANQSVITVTQESAVIAALGIFEAVLLTVMLHIERETVFGPYEMYLVNLFITTGVTLTSWARSGLSRTCTGFNEVSNWVQRLGAGASGSLQFISQSASSTNLVSQGGEQNC